MPLDHNVQGLVFYVLLVVFISLTLLAVFFLLARYGYKSSDMDTRPYFYLIRYPLIVSHFGKTKPEGLFSADIKTFHLKKGHRVIITNEMSYWASTSHGRIVSSVGGYLSNGTPIHFPVDRYGCIERLHRVKSTPEVVWKKRDAFVPHEKRVIASLFSDADAKVPI
ncbi:MAG: hypothetical protein A3D65_06345 [Candidatus Lloydbacteria bacterium RIFCSPHIGHO2_02_FULL_50_13]|uniref:Uncharacterized protein n=1 Tax=Candidatus Lloydbacteria bacterium RIFCSPHIGHO2_02_FULL_50_13 TaxID=1798661 RepID=A0A1G2D3E6_9BACT|nr:MAG: hypothetical protein A3D65_06345 [Candidatus Lloydbacteria bacterium RIFCSPHIGHO2_02_FULL_50_13]